MPGNLLGEVDDLAWDLARCHPTTMAGVIAVLQYTADDPDGERWPDKGEEDWTKTNEWWSTLHTSLAQALARMADMST
jgi:hypothetical protein